MAIRRATHGPPPAHIRGLATGVGALSLAVPATALAATGAEDGGQSARSIGMVVALVVVVGCAYLAAHLVVDRLERRLLIVAGLEYILLGMLLGPGVARIEVFENLTPLMPFIALAAGWVGLLRGTELQLREVDAAPAGTTRVVLVHHLLTGAVVGIAAWIFLTDLAPLLPGGHALSEVPWHRAAIGAGVLGCCAAADSTGPLELLERRYELQGELVRLLHRATLLGDLLVIFAFGLLFSIFHDHAIDAPLTLRPTEWAVVSIGIGIVLGLLFTAFLGGDDSPKGRFLALVGIITFASGAAWFLQLDPLLVNLVLGVVVVNTTRSGPRVHDTLESTERPMALVLLVLAGALWRPPALVPALAGLAGFLVLRLFGKVVGSLLTAWGTPLRSDLFRGLLAHGEVTVAMAVSFRLIYREGPAVDLAYTVILASVVFHDLIAPRLLRSLLLDTGDISSDVSEAPEAPESR